MIDATINYKNDKKITFFISKIPKPISLYQRN